MLDMMVYPVGIQQLLSARPGFVQLNHDVEHSSGNVLDVHLFLPHAEIDSEGLHRPFLPRRIHAGAKEVVGGRLEES